MCLIKICKHNKLSQSKVTGILVEEALFLRGVLDISKYYESGKLPKNKTSTLQIPNECFNDSAQKKKEILNQKEIDKKQEIQIKQKKKRKAKKEDDDNKTQSK